MILDTNVLIRLERELRKGEAGPATQFLESLPQGRICITPTIAGDMIRLKVKPEVTVCIVSCVTNFLASSDGPTSVPRRVEPVLKDPQAIYR